MQVSPLKVLFKLNIQRGILAKGERMTDQEREFRVNNTWLAWSASMLILPHRLLALLGVPRQLLNLLLHLDKNLSRQKSNPERNLLEVARHHMLATNMKTNVNGAERHGVCCAGVPMDMLSPPM